MNRRLDPRACTIAAGARLHFGPLAWRPNAGRDFGGWGVMVESPSCVVRVQRGAAVPEPGALAIDDSRIRAEQALTRCLSHFSSSAADGPWSVEVLQPLPAHRGLGSGTQLALAVGTAVGILVGSPPVDAKQLAGWLGRGQRSAVGIFGFEQGGLIVDAGKRNSKSPGDLAARCDVPAEWRFVLCWPNDVAGLTGDRESVAFHNLSPYPAGLTERLSHLILTEILPSVRIADFPAFAAALEAYGRLVGMAFMDLQGGIVHRDSQTLYEHLSARGVVGTAQSSWGPTLAVAQPSESEARKLVAELQPELSQGGRQWSCAIVSPKNRGATVHLPDAST